MVIFNKIRQHLLFYMKYLLLLFVLLSISVLPPAVAARAKNTLQVVFARAGLPHKVELSPQLKRKIEGMILGVGLGEMGEGLLQTGNLQEIIWQLWETGAKQQSEELTLLVRDTLENAEIIDMEDIGVGHSDAQLVKFANGLRGVFKTASNGDDEFIREVMVYHFDRLIGTHVFPLTTLRVIDGEEGSMQLFIENSMSAFDIVEERLEGTGIHRDKFNLNRIMDVLEVESPNVKTLKLLTLNSDRVNPQNYLFPFIGRVIAVDGSRAFSGGENALQKIARRMRAHPNAYNFDPTFISHLEQLRASATLTRVNDALLSLLPLKEVEDLLAIPYEFELERYANILSSRYGQELKHINFVRKSIDEYVVIAPTVDQQSPARLRTALQHRDFDTARTLLDNGLSGDAALDNALASHDIRTAEWLLAQGYQHNNERIDLHLESAIENESWQFVDWVLLEKKLDYEYKLKNIKDYLHTAWQRENAASIFEWASENGFYVSDIIRNPLREALDKKNFKSAMSLLAIAKQIDDDGLYVRNLVTEVLVAAIQAKKPKIIEQLVDTLDTFQQTLENNKIDLLRYGRFAYADWLLDLEKENYKVIDWVLSNGFFKDSSFFDTVEKAVVYDRFVVVRFLLRKYFATNSPIAITERLLKIGKYDLAKYWFAKAPKRHEILAHIAKTERYHNFIDYLEHEKEFWRAWSFILKKALRISLAKEDFVATYKLSSYALSEGGNILLDALKEAESWKFLRWLLAKEDVSGLSVLISAAIQQGADTSIEHDFEVFNWVLENIDAEETKKLIETLPDSIMNRSLGMFSENLQNRIMRDLYSYMLSEKPLRIPERYWLVLNFITLLPSAEEKSISVFLEETLNAIERGLVSDPELAYLPLNAKYTKALRMVMEGGDLQQAASLVMTPNVYGDALMYTIDFENYFPFVEWLVSLRRHSDVLLYVLNERQSWKFLGWLLASGRVDEIMYAALKESDFKFANWVLANVAAEQTKKLAETLKNSDANILESSVHSLRKQIERDLRTIFITASGEQGSNDIARIWARYRPLLSFLFANTQSMGKSIDEFIEIILAEMPAA